MKLFIHISLLALCVTLIPSVGAFAPQPSATQNTQNGVSETALFSGAWWDQGAGIHSNKPTSQPQFGAIQRAPGAPERLIPPQAWKNFSPEGKKRVEGQSRKS